MPYNPKQHSNLIVDKPYKAMLKELVDQKGQTLKRGLEIIIEKAHREEYKVK